MRPPSAGTKTRTRSRPVDAASGSSPPAIENQLGEGFPMSPQPIEVEEPLANRRSGGPAFELDDHRAVRRVKRQGIDPSIPIGTSWMLGCQDEELEQRTCVTHNEPAQFAF